MQPEQDWIYDKMPIAGKTPFFRAISATYLAIEVCFPSYVKSFDADSKGMLMNNRLYFTGGTYTFDGGDTSALGTVVLPKILLSDSDRTANVLA